MAVVSPRSSSLHHRATDSTPGYFELNHSLPLNTIAMAVSSPPSPAAANTLRLDAFHTRAVHEFNMPENTSIYAKRALPALPPLKTTNHLVKKAPSSASLRSPTALTPCFALRPSLQPINRTATTDCYERPSPLLPAVTLAEKHYSAGHQRIASTDSTASSKPASTYEVEFPQHSAPLGRPRQARSSSFRNFFNRNTYPGTHTETQQRSASSLSQSSDLSCADSCVDSVIDDPGLSMSKNHTPTSSTAGSRRPSTLSLASLRSRKLSEASAPAVPHRLSGARKNSNSGSGRRWNIFADKSADEDDVTSPSVPATPVTELSCVRCYYFSMRNCNGWIMGGSHGEACDTCTMHGFFGSP